MIVLLHINDDRISRGAHQILYVDSNLHYPLWNHFVILKQNLVFIKQTFFHTLDFFNLFSALITYSTLSSSSWVALSARPISCAFLIQKSYSFNSCTLCTWQYSDLIFDGSISRASKQLSNVPCQFDIFKLQFADTNTQ